jgi:hypothetical protein
VGYLARIGQAVRRWLPVESPWSDPKPDHDFHWVLDRYGGGPQVCCRWHEEHAFRVNPQATADFMEHLGGQERRYISERLGRSLWAGN